VEVRHHGDIPVVSKPPRDLFRRLVSTWHMVNHYHARIGSRAQRTSHVGVDHIATIARICHSLRKSTFIAQYENLFVRFSGHLPSNCTIFQDNNTWNYQGGSRLTVC
jgi:hypothetical protein